MSTGNILDKVPTTDGLYVVFTVHEGGVRNYFYSWAGGGAQIEAGADPKDYTGTRVSDSEVFWAKLKAVAIVGEVLLG